MTIADESPYDAVAEQYNERSEKHRANVSLWVDRLIRHVGANFSALDIGCGVGLSISILTHNGIRAAGIDASHKMVEFARARNPDVEIKHGNIFLAEPTHTFDILWLEAFIHLFPAAEADAAITHLLKFLRPGGILTLSTTVSPTSSEGWLPKSDYEGAPWRFRRHWTRVDLMNAFERHRLRLLDSWDIEDPFGKTWMAYITQYRPESL
ncbi:class I SAM-dependent methyltransferase [Catellatospora coxensis]|uniref:class I SAM-dependent methyltransferase n=1 Tax=Catellatospora coxensis TaxID=310354 RepID=UPI00194317A2|nr:class I SAM-dependent methyltransferase [Catellatospora coxensis]